MNDRFVGGSRKIVCMLEKHVLYVCINVAWIIGCLDVYFVVVGAKVVSA
jgi:hypothetical protein